MASVNSDLLYLTPIAPAPYGNGLAMRGWLFLKAASEDFEVQVVIVPVAGRGRLRPAAPATVVDLPRPAQVVAGLPALLGRPAWRDRLSQVSPLPQAARRAPATMAGAVIAAAGARTGTAVHAARSYLMPLAIAVAEQVRAPWVTADLDDDDQGLADRAGQPDEALGYERLIRVFGPLFQRLAVAGPADAAVIGARHGLAPAVIPNAVDPAPVPAPASACRGPGVCLLFVGNLTYWPNVDAASRLVRDVLPLVRAQVAGPVTVTLAGDTGPGHGPLLELAREPGVCLTGFRPDLGPCYEAADVAVIPLAHGAGTRIKLLEAFAAGVPVVTTAVGAAGLAVADGTHALIADTPVAQAAAVGRLQADPALRARLVHSALGLVRSRYSHEAVIPQVRAFFRAAGTVGQPPARPAAVPPAGAGPGRAGTAGGPGARLD
jgi:glycosyltransferase involved in cell wall biosynthesis